MADKGLDRIKTNECLPNGKLQLVSMVCAIQHIHCQDGVCHEPHYFLVGQIESNYDEVTGSFDAMGLNGDLLRGVYTYGFERPYAVQQRAIVPMVRGKRFY